jgi:hypothetical protein
LSRYTFEDGQVDKSQRGIFPSRVRFQPGERLLIVRGSGWALGFLQRGPIYEEALRHPEIEVFSE